MREIRTSGSTSGEEETELWRRLRHRHYGESRRQQLLPRPGATAPLLDSTCAVKRRRFSVGAKPTRQLVAPAGSNRSGGGGNEAIEAFDEEGRLGRSGDPAGRNVSERRASLETFDVGADPFSIRGRPWFLDGMSDSIQGSHRGTGVGMQGRGNRAQHGKPQRCRSVSGNRQPARVGLGRLGWRGGP